MNANPFASPEELGTTARSSGWSSTMKYLLGCGIVFALLMFLLLPLRRTGREAARITQCRNNLRQIGLALHNYHDAYGSFPPAYTVDSDGRRLHSWRTLILPFLEEQALYSSIDLSKPWDDPVNRTAFEKRSENPLAHLRCPHLKDRPGFTTYLAVADKGCAFHGSTFRHISEIKDGTSETLIVIETSEDRAVHWMAPQDTDPQMVLGLTEDSELSHSGGFQGLLADGSVRFISAGFSPSVRSALMTIDGDDKVLEF